MMKPLFTFGLVLACGLPAAGQIGSRHALGGSAAAGAQSRPLGGISRGGGGVSSGRRGGGSAYAYPYAYSFYVPNYFDNGYGYGYADNTYPVAPPPAPQLPKPLRRQPLP